MHEPKCVCVRNRNGSKCVTWTAVISTMLNKLTQDMKRVCVNFQLFVSLTQTDADICDLPAVMQQLQRKQHW